MISERFYMSITPQKSEEPKTGVAWFWNKVTRSGFAAHMPSNPPASDATYWVKTFFTIKMLMVRATKSTPISCHTQRLRPWKMFTGHHLLLSTRRLCLLVTG